MDRSIEDNLKFVMKATGWKGKNIQSKVTELLEMVEMKEKLIQSHIYYQVENNSV